VNPTRSDKVTLVIFTLNEIVGMRAIMPSIKREWYDELIIIDGGSTDGTIEFAKEHGYTLYVQSEKGLGAAHNEAIKRATGDIIVQFSPDGNSLVEKIPELVSKIKEGYDFVIVSRYLQGARSDDDDAVTRFGNWLFTTLTNIAFGGKVTDSLVIFKAYRRSLAINFKVETKEIAWGTQLLARCMKNKVRITEIPGDEPKRIGGIRKMDPIRNGLSELKMIIHEWMPPSKGHS
jgi:glycosyltransferase involved in cell wall biosynthesis